jgi:hypothetical protein
LRLCHFGVSQKYLSITITPEKEIVEQTQYPNNSKVFNYLGGVTS